jgi:hypothetical protein
LENNSGEVHEKQKKKRIRFQTTALETAYFLVFVNRTFLAPATALEQVDESADNFSFRYDLEKFKETKQEEFKTQYMNVCTALSDGHLGH